MATIKKHLQYRNFKRGGIRFIRIGKYQFSYCKTNKQVKV